MFWRPVPLTLLLIAVYCSQARDNGLGLTPQMGWSTWYAFGCFVNEKFVQQATDFVSAHLHQFGYEYINVDDCWAGTRDNKTKHISANKNFPSGMESLATYVHKKGLKFGLYSDAGNLTCAGWPGSLGYETIDAETYASWGVDYLKYDNCKGNFSTLHERYKAMGDALNKTSRMIFYSMCEWGLDLPAEWAEPIANSWRTTPDIEATWFSITNIATQNSDWWEFAGPGGWNDPDLLQVGRGKLNSSEEEAHFSLWAIMKAPLIISCNPQLLSNDSLRVLTNKEVIAVNQDPLGKQAQLLSKYSSASAQVYAGDLSDQTKALLILNSGSSDLTIEIDLIDLDYIESVEVAIRDLWLQADIGTVKATLKAVVPPHAVKMFKLRMAQTVLL